MRLKQTPFSQIISNFNGDIQTVQTNHLARIKCFCFWIPKQTLRDLKSLNKDQKKKYKKGKIWTLKSVHQQSIYPHRIQNIIQILEINNQNNL